MQARAVLRRVLRGRITFVPEGAGYVFTAPTRWDKLFTGIMAPMPEFLAGEGPAELIHHTRGHVRRGLRSTTRTCGAGLR